MTTAVSVVEIIADTAVNNPQPGRVASALNNVPANLPQKTQERIEDLPQNLIDEDEEETADYDFAGTVDSKIWRTETRFYTKKDGTVMMYFNYRARQGKVEDGKRIIPYRTGGKKVWQQSKKKKRRMN